MKDAAVEALRNLEYAGSIAFYADSEWPSCPSCGAIRPDRREEYVLEWAEGDPPDRCAGLDPHERPGGPPHADGCKLAALIRQ